MDNVHICRHTIVCIFKQISVKYILKSMVAEFFCNNFEFFGLAVKTATDATFRVRFYCLQKSSDFTLNIFFSHPPRPSAFWKAIKIINLIE